LNLRLPKLPGFKKYYKLVKKVSVCNVSHLDTDLRITPDHKITKSMLVELGYAHKGTSIKILGNGELSKSLHFE
jgi:ribosomal protein L15